MIKYEIKERDGYLAMDDLPHDCIFNKVRTGCGGTTIALTNDENYVIAVPTTELIINKLNSTENLFGLYGNFTLALKDGLINYTKQSEIKKIMCTYDKIPLLLEHVNGKDYRLLVDEYHNYWFHIKGSLIGEVLALVICAIVGLVIQFIL